MGKFLGKCGLLTAAVVLALVLLAPVLTPKWVEGHADNGGTYLTTSTRGFLSLEEDSVDVLFLGSSQVLRDISTARLLSNYGVSAYSRATTVQPPAVTYYYLEEALKTQSPKLVMADFSALFTEYDPDFREPYVRYAFDWMPLTWDKLEAVRNTLEHSQSQSLLDYALPALYYHGRWTELTSYDLTYPLSGDVVDPQRGAIVLDGAAPQDFIALEGVDTEPEPYTDSLTWYQKTMDLCAENNIRFIMLRLPRAGWTEAKHAADAVLAEENGVTLLDFNLRSLSEEIDLDAETDFYDAGHLNRAGSDKLTDWLGEYLTTGN